MGKHPMMTITAVWPFAHQVIPSKQPGYTYAMIRPDAFDQCDTADFVLQLDHATDGRARLCGIQDSDLALRINRDAILLAWSVPRAMQPWFAERYEAGRFTGCSPAYWIGKYRTSHHNGRSLQIIDNIEALVEMSLLLAPKQPLYSNSRISLTHAHNYGNTAAAV
jgi:hypothetical protein